MRGLETRIHNIPLRFH